MTHKTLSDEFMKRASKIKVAIASVFLATSASAGTYFLTDHNEASKVSVADYAGAAKPFSDASETFSSASPKVSSASQPNAAAPQEVEISATAPTGNEAASSDVQEVSFTDVSSEAARADILRKYPVLKETFDQVQSVDAVRDHPTRVRIHESGDLLLLTLEGSGFCGTAGCSLEAYFNDGSGYKNVLAASVNGPVSISRKDGKNELYFCAGDSGTTQWVQMPDNRFDVNTSYKGPVVPACAKFYEKIRNMP